MEDERQLYESRVVASTACAAEIMAHLDATWWLGSDVDVKLGYLRQHLADALAAVDGYAAARQAKRGSE